MGLGSTAQLAQKLADAAAKRAALATEHSAFRLVNGLADGLPGVTVDYYAGFLVLAASSPEAEERAHEIAELLITRGGCGVYLKRRRRVDSRRVEVSSAAPAEPIAGVSAPKQLVVCEGSLRFRVELGAGLSTGLFVDQRSNRAWVKETSQGRAVLNLFSYTCSFSIAAAAGGASRVVSVDLSRRALERGEHNFRLNGLDPGAYQFEAAEVSKFLSRADRREVRFDLIILDPPSFATTGRGKTFRADRDYADLAAACLGLLQPGGQLLAITNYQKFDGDTFRGLLQRAGGTRLQEMPSAPDCPGGPSRSILLTVG